MKGRQYAIVDIDGTIADVRHRLHHIRGQGKKNWKAFFEAMDRDLPIAERIEQVRELARTHRILIVTGRPEAYRNRTEKWLAKENVPYYALYMRRNGDHRPDYEAKASVFEDFPAERIAVAIDDRPPVCEMWERHGIPCIRVESDEENQEVNKLYQQKPGVPKKPRRP